jgi:hypothetical protein
MLPKKSSTPEPKLCKPDPIPSNTFPKKPPTLEVSPSSQPPKSKSNRPPPPSPPTPSPPKFGRKKNEKKTLEFLEFLIFFSKNNIIKIKL